MVETKEGLSRLKQQKPVSKRAQELYIKWSKGSEIKTESRRWRIGFRGPTGVGKTHKVFSMLEDHIELRAEEDDYIKEFFYFNPKLKTKLLKADLKTRRSWLRAGHKIIFMDFDNLGAQALIDAEICNPEVLEYKKDGEIIPVVHYIGISDWPSAIKAKDEGIKILREHEKKWGRMGCWFIIDNSSKAWSLCQSDFIKSVTGLNMNELMADIKIETPGKTTEARKEQARELSKIKDYTVISPSHNDEWIEPMLNTGFHVMMMSPNKNRITEVKEGDNVIKVEAPTLGGHPNNPFAMDYIIRLYKSDDGATRFADVDKARHVGEEISKKIANPSWRKIRLELEDLENESREKRRTKYRSRDYFDELPDIDDIKESKRTPKLNINLPKSDDLKKEIQEVIGEPIVKIPDDEPPKATYEITDEFLKSAKKKELQQACDQYGESTEGKKPDLIERLKRYHVNQKKVYDKELCSECERIKKDGNCDYCNPQEDMPDLEGW